MRVFSMLIPTYQEIKEVNSKAELLEKEVNRLILQQNDDLTAIDLLLEPKTSEIALYNQRIYILNLLAQIGRMETERGEVKRLFSNRNTDKLVDLYRTMVLLLRRIEFDLPSEYMRDIADFITSENLGATAIVGIINSSRVILQKDKVRKGIVRILREMSL